MNQLEDKKVSIENSNNEYSFFESKDEMKKGLPWLVIFLVFWICFSIFLEFTIRNTDYSKPHSCKNRSDNCQPLSEPIRYVLYGSIVFCLGAGLRKEYKKIKAKDSTALLKISQDGVWLKEYGFFEWKSLSTVIVRAQPVGGRGGGPFVYIKIKDKEYTVDIYEIPSQEREQIKNIVSIYTKQYHIDDGSWTPEKAKSTGLELVKLIAIAVGVVLLFLLFAVLKGLQII